MGRFRQMLITVAAIVVALASAVVVAPASPAGAAEPFDSQLRAAIPTLPYYSRSDVATATITTPLQWQYSVNDAAGAVSANVGTPAPTTFRANWRISAPVPAAEVAAARTGYRSTFCSKSGVFTLAVQDGAFGPQSCLGASGFGGAVDIFQSATPYSGYASAYRIGTCWTAAVGVAVTLLSPQSHGPRDKPAVIDAMRAAADTNARTVINALAATLDRGCTGTAPTTTRPTTAAPPTTRPPTAVPPSTTTTKPTVKLATELVDASPSALGGQALRRVVSTLSTKRIGTTADGASKLLIRVTAPSDSLGVNCSVAKGGGTCKPLGADLNRADTWNLIYKPPKVFGPGPADREVAVVFEVAPPTGTAQVATQALRLFRPPVVLVHGFLSSAAVWGSNRAGMIKALSDAGYRVSTVDYSKTTDQPLETNGPLVAQGITGAVEAFRAGLNVAVTKADVVGHSMGGILARYAAQPSIRAPVNRIVTLCTPHYGSDLARVARVVPTLDLSPLSSKAGLVATALAAADWWFGAGISKAKGAVADLQPASDALRALGATRAPAHAVSCVAENPAIEADAALAGLYDVVGTAFFENQGAVLDEVFDPLQGSQNENAERLFRILEDAYEAGLDPNAPPGDSGFFTAADPNLRAQLHQLLRAAIFGNQANDGVIRVESQWGGLAETFQSRVDGVVHTGAPANPTVQQTLIALLADPTDPGKPGAKFAKSWPVAGALTTDQPPGLSPQAPESRIGAINASNIVGAHANAISQVAKETNTVIVMRPVNPSAKPLIETGSATKGMRVKGKSSDWGPQNGYIAVDQLYSKLGSTARTADAIAAIGKFDCEVKQSVDDGVAKTMPLTVARPGGTYSVLVTATIGSGPIDQYGCRVVNQHPVPTDAFVQALTARIPAAGVPAVYLKNPAGAIVDANTLAPVGVDPATLIPLIVLADPRTGLLLTADYDLLAMGTRQPDPPPSSFDPDMGYITSRQRNLVRRLNSAVAATGYQGGRVVHHGPENQFTCSEKLDYPMTAFEPDGSVYTIEPGPSGAAQMPLKRYFQRKVSEGWAITPNPNWNWQPAAAGSGPGWEDPDTTPKVPPACSARTDDNDEIGT